MLGDLAMLAPDDSDALAALAAECAAADAADAAARAAVVQRIAALDYAEYYDDAERVKAAEATFAGLAAHGRAEGFRLARGAAAGSAEGAARV